jgi:hypothetical protein
MPETLFHRREQYFERVTLKPSFGDATEFRRRRVPKLGVWEPE